MRPRNQPTDSVGAVILPFSLPEPSHAQPVQPGVVARAKEEFERTLNQNLERLDEEIPVASCSRPLGYPSAADFPAAWS